MRYLGGKAKTGKWIASIVEACRVPGGLVVDMFCGALNVSRHLKSPRVAVDACKPLITMWQAAVGGWIPPSTLSYRDHRRIRRAPDPNDPVTAFAMFGCSYGGDWGCGFLHPDTEHNYVQETGFSITRKADMCRDLILICSDYRSFKTPPKGTVIYCDPPYSRTTGYDALPPFNSTEFWEIARQWAEAGCTVLVSEENAPPGWVLVSSWDQHHQVTKGKGTRRECIFLCDLNLRPAHVSYESPSELREFAAPSKRGLGRFACDLCGEVFWDDPPWSDVQEFYRDHAACSPGGSLHRIIAV